MADWEYTPLVEGFELTTEPPPTLVSKLEDGAFISREKHTSYRRHWREVYAWNSTQADAATDTYRTKGMHTSLTKYSWDPKDAAGATATARFAAPLRVTYRGGTAFRGEAEFVEDLG